MGKAPARPSAREPQRFDSRVQRRRYERVSFTREVRLWLDGRVGSAAIKGHMLDVSAGGCALHLATRPSAGDLGRVQVNVDGRSVWLPIEIRWVRADLKGWTAGAAFDRPTPEKQTIILELIYRMLRQI
jgi:c-di-GMP-binding flagellar brake protein YcgR